MSAKEKHLEFIQNIISRLARDSFLVKGWAITIFSAFMILGLKNNTEEILLWSIFPSTMFWFIDGYFLYQERLYRLLHDNVRTKNIEDVDYDLKIPTEIKEAETHLKACFSQILIMFYVTIIIMPFIINLLLFK
ncbi:MAG: hypothetical protein HQ556_13825 [Candidatus Marinimicrobia bacterium]|nr:hypothetical protein [Candidatus Neomarinimicrobiota bacterium]